LFDAVKKKDPKRFLYTIEFPETMGKYHYTGHRDCKVILSPEEAKKLHDICPVCRRKLTVGVAERVEELAERKPGFILKNAIPFKKVISLVEVIAKVLKKQAFSKTVLEQYDYLLKVFGTEFNLLLNASLEDLTKHSNKQIAEAVIRMRAGDVRFTPGYDGVYGDFYFNGGEAPKAGAQFTSSQSTLADYAKP
jgi:PHP family Zn ribbon phosphoesterase